MEGVNEPTRARRCGWPLRSCRSDQVRHAVRRGEGVMKAVELRELGVDDLRAASARSRRPGLPVADPEGDGAARRPRRGQCSCGATWPGSRRCCAEREGARGVVDGGEKRTPGRGRQRQDGPDRGGCRRAAGAARALREDPAPDVPLREGNVAKAGDEVLIEETSLSAGASAGGGAVVRQSLDRLAGSRGGTGGLSRTSRRSEGQGEKP
jgi:hypothetical protein